MIELIPLSVAAVTGVAIYGVGFLSGRASRRRTKPADSYRCGCAHSYAMHDPATGECHATIMVTVRDTGSITGYSRERQQCPCRHYTGEKPLNLDDLDIPGLPRPPEPPE